MIAERSAWETRSRRFVLGNGVMLGAWVTWPVLLLADKRVLLCDTVRVRRRRAAQPRRPPQLVPRCRNPVALRDAQARTSRRSPRSRYARYPFLVGLAMYAPERRQPAQDLRTTALAHLPLRMREPAR